jgi:hypothetical protein
MGRRRRRRDRRDASQTRTANTVDTVSSETAKTKPCSHSWKHLPCLRGNTMIKLMCVKPN